jgi:hypothetical protein
MSQPDQPSSESTTPGAGVKQRMTGDPEAEQHESHGHSTAAWTGVGVILLGTLVMSLAVAFASVPWFVVGAVVAVLGAAAGKVLAMAGYGARASTRAAAEADGPQQADLPGRNQHDSGTQ